MNRTRRLTCATVALVVSILLATDAHAGQPYCEIEGQSGADIYDLCIAAGNSHADCSWNSWVYTCNCYGGVASQGHGQSICMQ